MFRTTAIALLLASTAGIAHAAGPAPEPIQPVIIAAPTPSWQGGYVGGQIGYAYGDFSLDLGDFDNDSFIGGLTLGYLWSLGNGWYLGPEFQYDWADISITDPDTNDTATFDNIARLKLIAGYELGNGMLYGSIGYAYTSLDGIGDFFDGSSNGYVVGIGYDWKVADNWAVGGEYMYQAFDGIGAGGGDVDVNTIYLKATYRF